MPARFFICFPADLCTPPTAISMNYRAALEPLCRPCTKVAKLPGAGRRLTGTALGVTMPAAHPKVVPCTLVCSRQRHSKNEYARRGLCRHRCKQARCTAGHSHAGLSYAFPPAASARQDAVECSPRPHPGTNRTIPPVLFIFQPAPAKKSFSDAGTRHAAGGPQ